SKYNAIQMQYPGKALCVLKLPDGTALGYTLLPNEQAEILCSIDEQISSGSIDAKMQYTVFCSVADLLTQAETLQSTDINSCTSELISSFGVACMHVIESMTTANISSDLTWLYDPVAQHNGRFGRVTMSLNSTTIVDIGVRCGDNNPSFFMENSIADDSSDFFKVIRATWQRESRGASLDLASYFHFKRDDEGKIVLPAAERNSDRLSISEFQALLSCDMFNDNINNTAFVLALVTMADRFFPSILSEDDNKYRCTTALIAKNTEISNSLYTLDSDYRGAGIIDNVFYRRWRVCNIETALSPVDGTVGMCASGALPPASNLGFLVRAGMEGMEENQRAKMEEELRNVALSRLDELDNSGRLKAKYQELPIEGVLLEDEQPWKLFDRVDFSELEYMSMCLLASQPS
ncbi:hypothetical protein CS805_004371, partial [Escherichia coli]|nr:hypothetical protein [Escherichia coli]HDX6610846.1 hypothetical protein [Escherichia coli]